MMPASPHSLPYPIDALPDSIRNMVEEVRRNTQAPDALIGMTGTGVAATASQGLAVVQTPFEREVSLHLLQCVVAESGEGKTGVAHSVAQAIIEHDAARAVVYKGESADYRAQLARWQAVHRGLRRRLTALICDDQPNSDAAMAVEQHERCKPVPPRLRQTIRRDITERALVDALAGDCESILLLADEGNMLLQSGLLTRPALLSNVWDSTSTSLDRADGVTVLATHPCVSMLLMPQPSALRQYLEKHGNDAVDTGLLSRCFLAYPASTQGTRYVDAAKPTHEQTDKFYARVTELQEDYDRQIMSGEVKRRKMRLSKDAEVEWFKFHNYFEGAIKTTDYGYLGRSFVRKGSEHAARMAGVFHFFDDQEGDITLDTVKRAIEFVIYHANQFVLLTSALSDPALLQSQAKRLLLFLKTHVWNQGKLGIPKTQLMHAGPWQLRSKSALDRVLQILVDQQFIWLGPDTTKRLCVWLNAPMFQSFFAMYG